MNPDTFRVLIADLVKAATTKGAADAHLAVEPGSTFYRQEFKRAAARTRSLQETAVAVASLALADRHGQNHRVVQEFRDALTGLIRPEEDVELFGDKTAYDQKAVAQQRVEVAERNLNEALEGRTRDRNAAG